MFKNIAVLIMLTLLTACASNTPRNNYANMVNSSTTFTPSEQKDQFKAAVNEVLSGINTINLQEQVSFDKRDKVGIVSFMESAKVSMLRCDMASNNTNITSTAILIACEPFFRHMARVEYGDNLKTLRRHGMGKKIMFAIAAGAAGAAMANSNTYLGAAASGGVMITAASLAAMPNDWEVIEPHTQRVSQRAALAWQVAKINELTKEKGE